MAYRTIAKISCADDILANSFGCTMSISEKGELQMFGKDATSSFLNSESEDDEIEGECNSLQSFSSLKNIQAVHCCFDHTICLDDFGSVFTFGNNECCQLGVGDQLEFTSNPQKLNLPPIKQISGCIMSSLCVSEDGFIFVFGSNDEGELGLGNNEENIQFPKRIESLTNVDFIACGFDHTICKTFENKLFSWGKNSSGQLGIGNLDSSNRPIQHTEVPFDISDIVDIKCGMLHTVVLTKKQEVFSCGDNYLGQLGRTTEDTNSLFFKLIPSLSNIVRIECGYSHSMFIDENNNLFVCGGNIFSQLGLSDSIYKQEEPIQHPSLSNIVDLSSGGYHSFVRTATNEIYAFGRNDYSQLGIETSKKKQFSPIRVFEDNEDIWFSPICKPNAKSARN